MFRLKLKQHLSESEVWVAVREYRFKWDIVWYYFAESGWCLVFDKEDLPSDVKKLIFGE